MCGSLNHGLYMLICMFFGCVLTVWGFVDRTPVMTFFEDAAVKLLLVYMDGKELAAVG